MAEAGELDEAAELFGMLSRLAPNEASYHQWLGLICLRQGDATSAMEELRMAMSLAPGNQTIADDLNAAIVHMGGG